MASNLKIKILLLVLMMLAAATAAEEAVFPVKDMGGGFVAQICMGCPPKLSWLLLDTGSDLVWTQCNCGSSCFRQDDPLYDPVTSTCSQAIPCDDDSRSCPDEEYLECGSEKTCSFTYSYGDGFVTRGTIIIDYFNSPLSSGGLVRAPIRLGCSTNSSRGMAGTGGGVLGLGGGLMSLPTQLNLTSFSYCFSHPFSEGQSTFQINSSPLPNDVDIPVFRHPEKPTFYFVDIEGVVVHGEMFAIQSRYEVFIDSGTTYTMFPVDLYQNFRNKFLSVLAERTGSSTPPLVRHKDLDTCYNNSASSMASLDVPSVSFHVADGVQWPLSAGNLLQLMANGSLLCLTFAQAPSDFVVIGNIHTRGSRLTYDLANSQISIALNKC